MELRHVSYRPSAQCQVSDGHGSSSKVLSIVRCKSDEPSVQSLFLEISDTWLASSFADPPTLAEVNVAFAQLAELFEQLSLPSTGTIRGLWGELLLISSSSDPERMCRAWHSDPAELYDFVDGQDIIEVKTAASPPRSHHFSLAQLSPPSGARLVIASVIAREGVPGDTLRELVERVKGRVSAAMGLRIEVVVAATLGRDWEDAARVRFRAEPAVADLSFFGWEAIPTVSRALPAEVSDVRFRSDLDGVLSLDTEELRASGGMIASAVPRRV
jgi:hypothetical protein